jgi:hypothetical protein
MIAANKGCGCAVLRRASMTGSLSSASGLGSSSKLRRSSSSLYLQGLTVDSCGSPSQLSPSSSSFSHGPSTSVDQLQQTLEALDLCGVPTLPTPAPSDAEGKAVVLQTLLVLVALKVIPGYLLELLQNMDLQGVPLVIALGLVPTMMLKLKKRENRNDESLSSTSTGLMSSLESRISMVSLSELESHIRNSQLRVGLDDVEDNHSVSHQDPVRTTSSNSLHDGEGGADDWGQFAYYDETFPEQDAPATMMMRSGSQASSGRTSSLQTLLEMDEEEDEEWDEDFVRSCTF